MGTLISMADLASEYGYALVLQVRNQRVADGAAYAGALNYASTGSMTSMQASGTALAALNGLGVVSLGVVTSLVASPRANGNNAVKAVVTTADAFLITRVTLNIVGTSYVELGAGAPPCVMALSTGSAGVVLSGGTHLSTSGCAVASNKSVQVPCGTTLTSDTVDYLSAAPTVGCGGITPATKSSTTIKQSHTTDPFANNTAVTTATARLSTVASLSGPGAVAVTGGNNLSFGYSNSPLATGNACTASAPSNSGHWTVTCPAGGTYKFGSITATGGTTVAFDTSGTTSTYSFSGLVSTLGGSTLTFGSGTFNFAAGLSTVGGSTTTFGHGTFNIGSMSGTCGDGIYSICNTGTTLTFAGPALVKLTAGLNNNGGRSTVTFGSGSTTNSYQFGPSSSGNAIAAVGGSTTMLGDVGASGVFQSAGSIVTSGGGTCMVLPAATQHDIFGSIKAVGGLVMGAGTYTVTGYLDAGGGNGGDVACNGSTVGISAVNTTLVLGGNQTPSDGCSGQVFCVGSGFAHVTITAPTSGTYANLALVGPTTGGTAGAAFLQGSTNTVISGVFYLPTGPMTMSGAASVSSGGQCLELAASEIALSGGSAAATVCPGYSSSSATTASLVQ